MKFIRNKVNNTFSIEENKKLIETGYLGAEYVIYFYTTDSIFITKEDDECFYNNFSLLLDNKYEFYGDLSSQQDNTIIWFSDQYCDLSDEKEVKRVSRLMLHKIDDKIELKCINPYCEEKGINKSMYVISFSSSGNGNYSRNLDTNHTFQDDFIITCHNIVEGYKIKK